MAEIGQPAARPFDLGAAARTRLVSRGALRDALARSLHAEQERWFLWLPVMFGAGIALYFHLPAEPGTVVTLLPAIAALAVRYASGRAGLAGLATAALVTFALGLGAAKLRTEATRGPVLQDQIGPIDVYGFVELVEPRATQGQRVTLRVAAMEKLEAHAWPTHVRIRTFAENAALSPGDAVHIRATIGPPPGPALPGGYDFARAAWFLGLGGIGFARGSAELVTGLGSAPWSLRVSAAIERVRQAIGRRVVAGLPGQTGAIANALITGERGAISESTNQAFRNSGLFHILSISGLHMVVMAGAVFSSIRLLLAAIPSIALRYPIKKWSAAAAMIGALGYLLISGTSTPTVRSYIMISIMFLAVMLDRPALALRNVALAALAILVVWPESLLDPGFQMSFAAVVSLISAYEWLRERDGAQTANERRRPIAHILLFFGGIITSTLVASVAVAPFGIYHFHNTQQFAVLANLIAIPICNIIVMPAALATLVAIPFGLETVPLWVMGWGIEAMVWCANRVAALPGAVGRMPAVPTSAFVLIVVGGLWCTLWGTRWRLLGLVPIACGLALAPLGSRPDILVGRDAATVAVRDGNGRLSAIAARGSNFELARWLEHDADGRSPSEAAGGKAFGCDSLGCTAKVKGKLVAVPAAPAALRDDCALAFILVLKFARPAGCRPAGAAIDRNDVATAGAHAIYVDAGRVRIETVAQSRGQRPWAIHRELHAPASELADEAWPVRGNRAR